MIKLAILSSVLLVGLITISCQTDTEVLEKKEFLAAADSSVFEQTRVRWRVEYDSTAMGILVTAIDGVSQQKTAFWLYSVNGEPANISASEFTTDAGDTVRWQLTRIH
jgi:hypothetical protein